MRLVVRLDARDGDPDVVDAQIRFHLAAGADDVLRSDARPDSGDWVIDAQPGEFFWPRGESLKDVLAPIPPRYTIVQALVREFHVPPGSGSFDERATRRLSVQQQKAAGRTLLRPVHRSTGEARRVPLRAWYPLEVLILSGAADDADVEDTRLRDALTRLRQGESLALRTPDIVEDAAYAVECAEVGEVDLPRLEAYVAELEQRVAFLEQRLWPRVLRAASGVIRRR